MMETAPLLQGGTDGVDHTRALLLHRVPGMPETSGRGWRFLCVGRAKMQKLVEFCSSPQRSLSSEVHEGPAGIISGLSVDLRGRRPTESQFRFICVCRSPCLPAFHAQLPTLRTPGAQMELYVLGGRGLAHVAPTPRALPTQRRSA